MSTILPALQGTPVPVDERITSVSSSPWDGSNPPIRSGAAPVPSPPDTVLGAKLTGWWGRYGIQGTTETGTNDVIVPVSNITRWVESGRASHDHNDDMTAASTSDAISYTARVGVRIDQTTSMQSLNTNILSPASKFFDAAQGAAFLLFNPKTATASSGTPFSNHPAFEDSVQFLGIYFSTTTLFSYAFDTGSKFVSWTSGVDYSTNTLLAVMLRWDSSAGRLYGRLNGTARKETAFGAGVGGLTGTLRVGRNPRVGAYSCDILELITADGTNGVVTEQEEIDMMSYLVYRAGQLTVP